MIFGSSQDIRLFGYYCTRIFKLCQYGKGIPRSKQIAKEQSHLGLTYTVNIDLFVLQLRIITEPN